MFPGEVDDLEMELVPGGFREGPLQVALRLDDVLSRGEAPPLGATVDMGVDGKSGMAERL